MKKILVIRFGSLGDIILSSATVVNLRILFPASKIVYLTRERYRGVVEMIGAVDEIETIDNQCTVAGLYSQVVELDDRGFDIVIDLHGNLRSWFARKLLTADFTLVYPKRRMKRAGIVRGGSASKSGPHTIDLYNKTVESLGGTAHSRRPRLSCFPRYSNSSEPRVDRSTVAIAPGAAHDNKQFPLERFVEVAEGLSRDGGCSVVWLLTQKDAERLSQIDEHIGKSDSLVIDGPVPELAGIIRDCGLTIANDSGIAHLSSSLGTSTIAIFGPTHPALGFAPAGLRDTVVQSDQWCRPCSLHGARPCFREERFCFNEIPTSEIVETAKGILSSYSSAQKGIFVDRDGTLLVNKHYLSNPDDIEFEPGAIEALHLAKEKGYKTVIVSNQSGVARGFFTYRQLEAVHERMIRLLAAENVVCDDIRYCPHFSDGRQSSEYAVRCSCRKPSSGMVEDSATKLNIDIGRSHIIGDSMDDYHLALVTGANPLIVRSGHGLRTEETLLNIGRADSAIFRDNLLSAVRSLD